MRTDAPFSKPIRPRKLRRIGLYAIITLCLLLGVGGSYAYYSIAKSLPVTRGEIKMGGLEQAVSVYRDASGVPHIIASTPHDLYMAQGFITAQDRLFQMDLSRRQASGQLSEVIGNKALSRDKFFRTLGLRRAAEMSLPVYSKEAQQTLEWYAQGVNAYIEQTIQQNKLPVEFQLLGYQPKPWTPVDSLTIGKYMAFDLGGHWEGSAFRYYLTQNFPADKAFDLFPTYPVDAPTIIETAKNNPINLSKSFASAVIPYEWNGSNNWVVSGSKTKSGKPILSNDPHLALGTPSIWYETHLQGAGIEVSGVIFAGVPGIIVGHNRHIAWGVTNVDPDVQDLYIEKRNPQNPKQFLYQEKWETATVILEEIAVKDELPVKYEVLITRHGPIISEFAHDDQPNQALSLRWTALQPTTELEAVLKFNLAANWGEFKEALTYFQVPTQNFVFASTDGTIAYRANGLIPIRKKGDSSVPVPGWTDEYEWQGFIPWDELPTIVNPPSGFIATANNKVVDDTYPFHITNTWSQPFRQQRILQFLNSKPTLTVEDMQQLQFDHHNLQAEELLPMLLPQLLHQNSILRPLDQQAVALLQNWDKVDRTDASAPLIFNIWMAQMADTLFKGQIDPQMYKLFEGKSQVVDELIRRSHQGNEGPWMTEKGGLDKVALLSFQQTIDKIVGLQGDQPAKWNWGSFHKVTFSHPLAAVKPLDLLFNPDPVPLGGSKVTVAQAAWDFEKGIVEHGGAWRRVIDLADTSKSYNVVGPGQSGHVFSPWYDDQIGAWTTGKYHITSLDDAEFSRTQEILHLTPNR